MRQRITVSADNVQAVYSKTQNNHNWRLQVLARVEADNWTEIYSEEMTFGRMLHQLNNVSAKYPTEYALV